MSCIWPHEVSTINVFDRDSYEKYKDGTYQPPVHCFCGAEIKYSSPFFIVLLTQENMDECIYKALITNIEPVKFIKVDFNLPVDEE